MRKNALLLMLVLTLLVCVGCEDTGDVKVYDDTEEYILTHDERNLTAVVTGVDLENNLISFMECATGYDVTLTYHGGVSVLSTFGNEIGIDSITCGMIVDISYYYDVSKLVSITINSKATVVDEVNKLTLDMDNHKAVYRGTSCTISEHLRAFDGDKEIDPMEISTEDQLTLYMYGGKLISISVTLGHGYVRLINQDSYIGGMVEIGYDVIVPVTDDMLVAVREGNYTLRINKNGYSNTKEVYVIKDKEIEIDLASIAVPTGTVTFDVTPDDAKIYVEGTELSGYAYSNLYGSYGLKIEADGYNTFNGSFKISKDLKVLEVELVKSEDATEETTEDKTEDTTTTDKTTGNNTDDSTTDKKTTTRTSDTEGVTNTDKTDTTTEEETSGNVIKVNSPVGVGVYLDGEYKGVAPVSFKKEAGTHTVLLYQTGYLIKSYTITVTDDGQDDEYNFAELTSLADLLE